jgi:uncharacterized protein with HEPN domain
VSEHDDQLYLSHIDDVSASLRRTARLGKEVFLSDADVRDATLYRLQTIAESMQHLSSDFKAAHPEIPCADIAGFRNRAVHGYLTVSLDIVWDIVERDIPELARCIQAELELRNRRSGPTRVTASREITVGDGQVSAAPWVSGYWVAAW